MTRTEKYRNSRLHRTCKFCVYYHHRIRNVGFQIAEFSECDAKNKKIKHPDIVRPFCPCFLLDIEECRKIDERANMTVNPKNEEDK